MNVRHWVSDPASSLRGVITVPGDKSISHRALFLGSIAEGTTLIHGFSAGGDCASTWRAFEAMGVSISRADTSEVMIHGVGKNGLSSPDGPLDCGNSGTTMRLLMGLLAAQPFDTTLMGDESLSRRPMNRVAHPLIQMGGVMTTQKDKPPVFIRRSSGLQGVHYLIPKASAQIKTALLLAGLFAVGKTELLEPILTRDHTERMLRAFSYPLHKIDNHLTIDASHVLKGTQVHVPGDFSSAAFFIVAATLIPGSEITIKNVGVNPTRLGLIDLLNAMGACIAIRHSRWYGEEPVADLHVRYAPLKGITIPAAMVPLAIDEFPILFIAAACASGQTCLRGARELRYKESDRIGVMVEGLRCLGIEAFSLEDGVLIHGGVLRGGCVLSHGDHRVAMAFAIAGAVARSPVTVLNCHVVSTSFPQFVDTANQIQCAIKEYEDE